jgi:hypothetical protein
VKKLIYLLAVIPFFISCQNNRAGKYPYAIRDFSLNVQPYLAQLVSEGTVDQKSVVWDTLKNILKDNDLLKLCKSEHPALRALAFSEMITRKSFDYLSTIFKHLDDTALVTANFSESINIWWYPVSDYAFRRNILFDTKFRNIIIDSVISNHYYLPSAYLGLNRFRVQERHYGSIKKMVIANLSYLPVYYKEYPLYALASYKRKEDIPLIMKIAKENLWATTGLTFKMMQDFPDTCYLEILEEYDNNKSFYFSPHVWEDYSKKIDAYIQCIVSYKSKRSASLLKKIFVDSRKVPKWDYDYEANELRTDLQKAVWDSANLCDAYIDLRKLIPKPVVKKNDLQIQYINTASESDSPTIPYGW